MGPLGLADPDYVNKLRAGKYEEIRPCISCQEGCMGRVQAYSMINCAVNPQAARERVTAYEPILQAKRVLIAGGETALWLAQQGKKGTIVEALDKLMAVHGPLCHANKDMLGRLLPYNGVEVLTGAKVKSFSEGILKVEALEEENSLYQELEFDIPEIYLLGNA